LRGCKLDNKEVLSKSDPFFVLKTVPGLTGTGGFNQGGFNTNPLKKKKNKTDKKNKDLKKLKKTGKKGKGGWIVIHQSEVINNNLNPVWAPFTIDVGAVCNGNLDQSLLLEVWDHNDYSSHALIGSNRTSIRELTTLKEVRLDNPERIGFTSTAGKVEVLSVRPITH